jgi:hypothetical protein
MLARPGVRDSRALTKALRGSPTLVLSEISIGPAFDPDNFNQFLQC